jgi:glucoamylase
MADLSTGALPEGTQIKFTFFWNEARHWEGADFSVTVGKPIQGQ